MRNTNELPFVSHSKSTGFLITSLNILNFWLKYFLVEHGITGGFHSGEAVSKSYISILYLFASDLASDMTLRRRRALSV